MEESGNGVTDEDRPRPSLKGTEEQMQKLHRLSRVVRRSDRPNKSAKPRRFREVYYGMQMRHLNKRANFGHLRRRNYKA